MVVDKHFPHREYTEYSNFDADHPQHRQIQINGISENHRERLDRLVKFTKKLIELKQEDVAIKTAREMPEELKEAARISQKSDYLDLYKLGFSSPKPIIPSLNNEFISKRNVSLDIDDQDSV
jgi:hypothetical protein